MNPSNKGWLQSFLVFKQNQFTHASRSGHVKLGQDPDQSFYGIIQPTGLMYGFPVQSLKSLSSQTWDDKGKIKVLLINSLINIAQLYHEQIDPEAHDIASHLDKTIEDICLFYDRVYPELSISPTTWLGKKKDLPTLAEQLIEKRVNLITTGKHNFWLGFFNRSQLFLDIYIFGQWCYTKPDEVLEEFFKSEKEELSFNAVKVMAAAAHANSHVEDEEVSLFNYFIESINMPSEKKRVAKEYFDHGLGIQDIPISSSDPWIVRKFLLELALLTVWSDKRVEAAEMEFLVNFSNSLGFSEEELDKSIIAIEGFVLENWSNLDILQNKKNYEEVSEEFISRMAAIALKYKYRIANDIKNDHKLVRLIQKGQTHELNEEDQLLIKTHLSDILSEIPVFNVIALPDNFFNYSNILRIVPKEVIQEIIMVS